MAANDPEYRGQPQAAARELRGKKRVEDLFHGLAVHSTAIVSNFEIDVASRGVRGVVPYNVFEAPLVAVDHPRRHDNRAALVSNGFRRISDEIHHNLPDLSHVRHDTGKVARELVRERRLLADGYTQEVVHLPHQVVDGYRLHYESTLARIREHLSTQIGRAPTNDLDVIQITTRRVPYRKFTQGKLGIP